MVDERSKDQANYAEQDVRRSTDHFKDIFLINVTFDSGHICLAWFEWTFGYANIEIRDSEDERWTSDLYWQADNTSRICIALSDIDNSIFYIFRIETVTFD